MNSDNIDLEIEDLKADYARLSADLEKLVYVGANTEYNEKELDRLEKKIAELRKKQRG